MCRQNLTVFSIVVQFIMMLYMMSSIHIDLRTARHIISLAEHLSFTRAASSLGLTQSALSRSIQRVEQALGVTLFDRDRANVRLTVVGETVVRGAAELLRQSRAFDETLGELSGGAQACVKFGMARTAAAALLPQVLGQESGSTTGRQTLVAVRSFDALADLLLAGEIEFFVSAEHGSPRPHILDGTAIADFPMIQLVRTGHPLLKEGARKHYDAFPWMISSMFSATSDAVGLGYPHLRATPEIVVEDLGCAASLTEETDIIWVTSSFSATRQLREGRLTQLPFPRQVSRASRPPYKLMIYRLRGRTLSPAAQNLVSRFTAVAGGLQEGVENSSGPAVI